MEQYAYQYATKQGYDFPKYNNYTSGKPIEGIPMKDLFDMLTGTSTGSILAAGLSVPVNNSMPTTPKYWARDAINIYKGGATEIFKQNSVGKFFQVLTYIVFIGGFTVFFFLLGNHKYNNSYKKRAHKELHKFLEKQDERLRERNEKRKLLKK